MAARQEDLRQSSQPFLFAPSGEQDMRRAVLQTLPDDQEDDGIPEGKEPIEIYGVRLVQPKDLLRILRWFDDPETQRHLSPLPKVPQDWSDPNQVTEGQVDLANYYSNQGEPKKITSLAAVNEKDKVLGVVTIRWKGDPWKGDPPEGERIASIERLLVNPKIRGRGIGERLIDEALEEIFGRKNYPEARTWIMSDEEAPGWGRIVEFFTNKFGFEELLHPDRSWAKYQERRGMEPDGRDAKWHVLKKVGWERYKIKKEMQKENIPQNSIVSMNGSTAK